MDDRSNKGQITCDGNCMNCPYPDVPKECLDKPLTDSELETAVRIDMQATKYALMDPDEKRVRLNELARSKKDGRVAGIKKEKPNNYPEFLKQNREAYGEINSAIRAAREVRGWTARELAQKVGKTRQTVSYWELGHFMARWDLLVPIMPELAEAAKKAEAAQKTLEHARNRGRPVKKLNVQDSKMPWKASEVMNERLRKKMSQEEVAVAIGVTRRTIQNWEKGRTKPNWRLLATIFPRFQLEDEGET